MMTFWENSRSALQSFPVNELWSFRGRIFPGFLWSLTHTLVFYFAFQALWTADFPASKRSTPAYLGRYIRASPTSSCSFVHYAFSGVGGAAPALRLRSRNGVFHRRAAPPHSPDRAPPSARTSPFLLTSSRLRLVRARPPATVCGFPFVVNYSTDATLPITSSRAAGWVSPAATSGTSDGSNL